MDSSVRSDWLNSHPFSVQRSIPFIPYTTNRSLRDDGQDESAFSLLSRVLRNRTSFQLRQFSTFRVVGRLGEGTTYIVEKGTPDEGDEFVAVKRAKFTIPKGVGKSTTMNTEEFSRLKSVLLEIEILAHPPLQSHPNITSLLGVAWDSESPGFAPMLIVELATFGSLCSLFECHPLTDLEKRRLCLDVSCGLEVLQKCMIVHGDVKQDNVLVFPHPARRFIAKLTDFEHALLEEDGFRYLGTPAYNAPEVHERNVSTWTGQSLEFGQLHLCDIFAFGLLVFEVFLSGQRYFLAEGGSELRAKIYGETESTSISTLPALIEDI